MNCQMIAVIGAGIQRANIFKILMSECRFKLTTILEYSFLCMKSHVWAFVSSQLEPLSKLQFSFHLKHRSTWNHGAQLCCTCEHWACSQSLRSLGGFEFESPNIRDPIFFWNVKAWTWTIQMLFQPLCFVSIEHLHEVWGDWGDLNLKVCILRFLNFVNCTSLNLNHTNVFSAINTLYLFRRPSTFKLCNSSQTVDFKCSKTSARGSKEERSLEISDSWSSSSWCAWGKDSRVGTQRLQCDLLLLWQNMNHLPISRFMSVSALQVLILSLVCHPQVWAVISRNREALHELPIRNYLWCFEVWGGSEKCWRFCSAKTLFENLAAISLHQSQPSLLLGIPYKFYTYSVYM